MRVALSRPSISDVPSVNTFAPLCSREYLAIVSVEHIAARMPRTLLAAIAEPIPAPSIAIPASDSPRDDALGNGGRDIRIVDRFRAVGADVCHRNPSSAQVLDERPLHCQAGVIVADGDAPDVVRRREIRRKSFVARTRSNDSHAPGRQRVTRERRHVTGGGELHRGADIERPRVGLCDDVEFFHR